MGALKDLLERALRENNQINEDTTEATILFKDFYDKFMDMRGQVVIWKTLQNPNLKHPQLVIVEQPYRYFVLVKKIAYNSQGEENVIRYGVNYSSLFVGHDTIESLEVSL